MKDRFINWFNCRVRGYHVMNLLTANKIHCSCGEIVKKLGDDFSIRKNGEIMPDPKSIHIGNKVLK